MHPPLSQVRSNRIVLDEPGTATANWYWQIGRAPGHEPCVRALLNGTGAFDHQVRRALVQLVKKGRDSQLPDGSSFGEFVYGYLLDALCTDPVCANAHVWCCYPAHAGPSDLLPLLSTYLPITGPLSENAYLQLLLRHTAAPKAAYARLRGSPVTFRDQVQSVHVDPAHRSAIRGRRILVLDDYSTKGYSFEWARTLLLEAGAAGVVFVALAKCGLSYHRQELNPARSWSPFRPVTFTDADLTSRILTAPPTCAALHRFTQAYRSHLAC